jgi:hypothetical protein
MASSGTTPFPFDVIAELSTEPERVRRYLEEYFRCHDDPDAGFTGRLFEQFIAHSDPYRSHPGI